MDAVGFTSQLLQFHSIVARNTVGFTSQLLQFHSIVAMDAVGFTSQLLQFHSIVARNAVGFTKSRYILGGPFPCDLIYRHARGGL